MGCDIHTYVEVRGPDGAWRYTKPHFRLSEWDRTWAEKAGEEPWRYEPFDSRSYAVFGVLAGVRNYSEAPMIANPKGFPIDVSPEVEAAAEYWGRDAHSRSWLSVAELTAFDWDKVFWDRRVTKQGDGAARADEGEGKHVTLREHVGDWFFCDLETLKNLGDPDDVRVVFWFDN